MRKTSNSVEVFQISIRRVEDAQGKKAEGIIIPFLLGVKRGSPQTLQVFDCQLHSARLNGVLAMPTIRRTIRRTIRVERTVRIRVKPPRIVVRRVGR